MSTPPLQPTTRLAVHPVFAVVVFAASIASYYIPAPSWALIFALTLVTYIILPWVAYRLGGVSIRHVFRRGHLPRREAGILLLASIVIIPAYLILVIVLAKHFPSIRHAISIDIASVQMARSTAPLLAVAAAGFILAFAEEFFFRAFLQSSLQRWGGIAGLIAASACFAIAHHAVGKLLPMFLMGLWFGYVYWRSGSLWLATTAHFLVNATSFAAVVYLASGSTGRRVPLPHVPASALIIALPAVALVLFLLEKRFRVPAH